MIMHNLIKYLVQTRLHFWDIKIKKIKLESCPNDLLKIYYFYISQTKSILDKIFHKVVYYHIIYMCDFFDEFRRPFCHGLHEFSQKLWFALDTFPSWNVRYFGLSFEFWEICLVVSFGRFPPRLTSVSFGSALCTQTFLFLI